MLHPPLAYSTPSWFHKTTRLIGIVVMCLLPHFFSEKLKFPLGGGTFGVRRVWGARWRGAGRRIWRRPVGAGAGLERERLMEQEVKISRDLSIRILEAGPDMQQELVDIALNTTEGLDTPQADPYGAVLWPAALVSARALIDLVAEIREKSENFPSVLELGAGTGLVSLTAAAIGCNVIATDFQATTIEILDHAISANNLTKRVSGVPEDEMFERQSGDNDHVTPGHVSTDLFDFSNFDTPLPPGDIVVAADVLYYEPTAKALARRCVEALKRGSHVIVGDKGRPGRPAFLSELERLGVGKPHFEPVYGQAVVGYRNWVIADINERPTTLPIGLLLLDPNLVR